MQEEIRRALMRVISQAFPDTRVYDWSAKPPESQPLCQRCGRGGAWVVRRQETGEILLALCGMCTKAVARTGKLEGTEPRAEPVVFELDLAVLDAPDPPHGFETDAGSDGEWWICSLCGQSVYDPVHRDERLQAMVEQMTRHLDRGAGLQFEYLEAMTAAYLMATKVKPDEAELVQQIRDGNLHFWYQKRGAPVPGAPPHYKLVITPAPSGLFVATCPALPGLSAEAGTPEEARARGAEAVERVVASIVQLGGEAPPDNTIVEEVAVDVESQAWLEEGPAAGAGGEGDAGH